MQKENVGLFSLPGALYAPGAPVLILSGVLTKEEATNRVQARIRYQNLAPKTVKSITAVVRPLDTAGRPLGEPFEKVYLDFAAPQGAEFGVDCPIAFPNPITRAFTVAVREVIFADNSIWDGSDSGDWETLPPPDSLAQRLGDPELVRQVRLDFGDACRFAPAEHRDLWRCACGTWNRDGRCFVCGNQKDALLPLDLQRLAGEKDARLEAEAAARAAEQARREAEAAAIEAARAAEQARREAEAAAKAAARKAATARRKAAADKAKRKALKILPVFIALVVLALVAVLAFKVVIPAIRYAKAVELLEDGQYDEAIAAFKELDDYKDSRKQLKAAKTAKLEAEEEAARLEAERAAEEARLAAEEAARLAAEEAARIEAERAAEEARLAAERAAEEARLAAERAARIAELSEKMQPVTLSAGAGHTVGLKADGTVVAVGDNEYGQCEVSGWKDIVAVAAGERHTVGLKSDGSVVAVGLNDNDQCEVSGWSDIVAVSAGYYHTVGLKADGTVVAVGDNDYGQCEVSGWSDIVAVSAGVAHTVGLRADGSVVAVGRNNAGQCKVSGWKDIVAVSAGDEHTVGAKADGTVVAVGDNDWDQCDVSDWTDIVAVAAGNWSTVGLKADGTVIATGNNGWGQCEVSDWKLRVPD